VTVLRKLLLPLLAVALVVSACADGVSSSTSAATVNGVDMPDDEFIERLQILADNSEFAEGLVQIPVHADGEVVEDRVDSAFAAGFLELSILLELIGQEFEERGLETTPEDLEAARASFAPELAAYLEELPEDFVDWFVEWNAQLAVLRDSLAGETEVAEVTDEAVRAFYDENIADYENQVCARHILLETAEEADAVLAELEGGADFATIATDRSIDPSAATNGGDLGCGPADQYVEPFAAAISDGEVGEYLGPVETEFGNHVIVVDSRGTTPFEEAEVDIRTQLEQEAAGAPAAAFNELFEELIASADVTVSSRYGSWNDEEGRVVPPEAPEGETSTLPLG
jgi:parvulin-like peptidyl-prolyl isomerase